MYTNRTSDTQFPAVLQDEEGKLLETGSGCVSPEDDTVDFKAEFVPLFKMGTPLQVVRMAGEVEVHRFCGKVYLSSQQLLRLTEVSDEVLPAAAGAFLFDVEMAGTAEATLTAPAHESHFRLLRRAIKKEQRVSFPVQIHVLSVNAISFTVAQGLPPLEHGQLLTLRVAEPISLEQVSLQVTQVLSFGDAVTGYQCRIGDLPESSRKRLWEFVSDLASRCKIF